MALDNLKRRGSELNIEWLKATGVEFVHGDIRNREDLQFVHTSDIPIYLTDHSKVSQEIGWQTKRTLMTILTDVYDWLYNNEAELKHILNE